MQRIIFGFCMNTTKLQTKSRHAGLVSSFIVAQNRSTRDLKFHNHKSQSRAQRDNDIPAGTADP